MVRGIAKAKIGDRVRLSGNTSKVMNFKKGIVRKIGHTNNKQRIYYVSKPNSKFTTPFLTRNIRKKK